jgi:uncharacterized protein (TIGR00255 family)
MSLSSMTGFARAEGEERGRRFAFEVKSVNGRGLELRFRLPPGFDRIEGELRKLAGETFARGSITVHLDLDAAAGDGALRVNAAALDQALAAVEMIRQRIDCEKPRAEGILALRGVTEAGDDADDSEESRAALDRALVDGFRSALAALKAARDAEGRALAAGLLALVDEIERLAGRARGEAGASLPAIRARIADQLKELMEGAIAEERLAQEAALLAMKADIREELDRLDAHVGQARALLTAGGPAGRKLDFLSQEFNREANTLAAKASDMALKRLGLELKTAIDQFREQVQNIE